MHEIREEPSDLIIFVHNIYGDKYDLSVFPG